MKKPENPKRKRVPADEASDRVHAAARARSFPIVAVGASAGGLEALEQFLGHIPPRSGMAFVIIQHLDPTHKGVLPELLQRFTPMEVTQVKDGTPVRPDSVYIIPPNKDMSIIHGKLHLLNPVAPRGLRLPIDTFFRSLAADQQERSVGVILSGMGSDGTLGLRAIKEKAGLSLAQAPATAKFSAMPGNAIDAGLVDIVAPAEDLPAKIVSYWRTSPILTMTDPELETRTVSGLEKALVLLRTQTGYDFTAYKKSTMYRRIERRMGIHQIDKLPDYIQYLQENPQEVELLFKELLIGVTSFFRDPPAWEYLQSKVIGPLLETRPTRKEFRAWVPGCSTGEEAYSLAMIFNETIEKMDPKGRFSLQVFATDLDSDAIQKARQGLFPPNITSDVPPERLSRFFVAEDSNYRVAKEIRDAVVFAQQNIIADPPFTKVDFLLCRNLLIYLEPDVQHKLLPLFHYCLNPGGILFLGTAESIGTYTDLFEALDSKLRIYRRTNLNSRAEAVLFPESFAKPAQDETAALPPRKSINVQSLTDQLLLEHHCPAAVLVNNAGDILYVSGRTGRYLEPAAGKANWNVLVMAREGLRRSVASALQKVVRQKGPVTYRNIEVASNGGAQMVDLTVEAVEQPEELRGKVLVVFRDVPGGVIKRQKGKPPKAAAPDSRMEEMENELTEAREEVQTIREEMQTSQEELKSSNEELQSTNEELQSTNEELTTSREEMQSMNEELQTVNAELQAKLHELTQTDNDMRNLLNSTEIATIFLDEELRVQRFTPKATRIIKLIQSDVGRPLADLASDMDYPDLYGDAEGVLSTLVPSEKQIPTRDRRWFSVRIMPYRTIDNRINGVVITLADITVTKLLEADLRTKEAQYGSLFESVLLGLIYYDEKGSVIAVNPAASRMLDLSRDELLNGATTFPNRPAIRQDGSHFPEEDYPSLVALKTGVPVRGAVMGLLLPGADAPLWVLVDAVPVFLPGGTKPHRVYITLVDVTHYRPTS